MLLLEKTRTKNGQIIEAILSFSEIYTHPIQKTQNNNYISNQLHLSVKTKCHFLF